MEVVAPRASAVESNGASLALPLIAQSSSALEWRTAPLFVRCLPLEADDAEPAEGIVAAERNGVGRRRTPACARRIESPNRAA